MRATPRAHGKNDQAASARANGGWKRALARDDIDHEVGRGTRPGSRPTAVVPRRPSSTRSYSRRSWRCRRPAGRQRNRGLGRGVRLPRGRARAPRGRGWQAPAPPVPTPGGGRGRRVRLVALGLGRYSWQFGLWPRYRGTRIFWAPFDVFYVCADAALRWALADCTCSRTWRDRIPSQYVVLRKYFSGIWTMMLSLNWASDYAIIHTAPDGWWWVL